LLAITCDNASNMDTMIHKIAYSLNDEYITFESQHQHIRCLAHIINLSAKCILEGLDATGLNINENIFEEMDDNSENLKNTIYKVILNYYNITELLLIIILIFYFILFYYFS
jgi:hypothetical protein